MRLADVGDTGLRQAEEPDLARLDELLHRADGLLDRDVRVHAVLVVQVDIVDVEPMKRASQASVDVVRRAVDAHPGAVRVPHIAELGRQLRLGAATGDGFPEELLVRVGAVHVSGVEQGDAQVEGTVDSVGRLSLIGLAVGAAAHAHAA